MRVCTCTKYNQKFCMNITLLCRAVEQKNVDWRKNIISTKKEERTKERFKTDKKIATLDEDERKKSGKTCKQKRDEEKNKRKQSQQQQCKSLNSFHASVESNDFCVAFNFRILIYHSRNIFQSHLPLFSLYMIHTRFNSTNFFPKYLNETSK